MKTTPLQLAIPLALLLSIVGLTVKTPTYRYTSFALILSVLIVVAKHGLPPVESPVAMGLTTLVFVMSDFLVLTNPHAELRMVGQTQPADEFSFLARLRWAVLLLISPRMVGWAGGHTAVVPSRPHTTSKLSFALAQLLGLVLNLLIFNAANITMSRTPEFSENGPKLSSAPWFWRSTHVLQWGLAGSSFLRMAHQAWILCLLATGQWIPSDFPPLFGSWGNAYTVRKFWGRTWHQLLTRMLTTHSRFVSQKILGMTRRRSLTRYTELYVVFFFSGLLHHIAEYISLGDWGGRSIQFFVLQAVAIHCEGILLAIASKLGFRQTKLWEMIGYIWVWQWFTWCLPMWLEPQIGRGIVENGPRVRIIETVHSYVMDVHYT